MKKKNIFITFFIPLNFIFYIIGLLFKLKGEKQNFGIDDLFISFIQEIGQLYKIF
jgi:hypothetical protein